MISTKTVQRRATKKVSKMKNENGIWVGNESEISKLFYSYFQNLFKSGTVSRQEEVLKHVKKVVSEEMNIDLICRCQRG